MDAKKEPLPALAYSEPAASPFRVADLVCHVVFAAGVGLLLGGASAIFYNYASVYMEWYPHMITLGAFMAALVISFRIGRIFK